MATAEFSKFAGILSAALSQHHLLGFESITVNILTYSPRYFLYIYLSVNKINFKDVKYCLLPVFIMFSDCKNSMNLLQIIQKIQKNRKNNYL